LTDTACHPKRKGKKMRQPTIAPTTKIIPSSPSALAVAVAAIIAIGIALGAYALASRTSTSTPAPPPAPQLIQPVSPAFAPILKRSRIRVLDPTKPPF
jgi:hypothetical protein